MADDTASPLTVADVYALLGKVPLDPATPVYVDVLNDQYDVWDIAPATAISIVSLPGGACRVAIRLRPGDDL